VPPRSFWKGYLKLSLVTCPVTMMPATTDAERVRFHTLNRKTGNRINSQYVDAETGRVVDEEDTVKGYENGPDEFVMLEDEELEEVALESTRTIDIETFVPADSIEWIWYDQPHYLMPDDAVAEEAFSVIRDAMSATKTVAISRLVLYRRERAVMLHPHDRGIILWTLRYGDEVRDPEDYFADIKGAAPEKSLVSLVKKLVADRTKPWKPAMVHDPVQEQLLDIIAEKKHKPRKRTKTKTEKKETPSNVISIVDALRKSIASEAKRTHKK
jgi:DNA end-binding protein Ku